MFDNTYFVLVLSLLLPLIGTTLGAAMVIFARGGLKPWLQKILLGFASGVMVAASIWSLIIPALDLATKPAKALWVPAAAGFVLGMGFLLLLDTIVPHIHINSDEPEGIKTKKLSRTNMMIFAVTLHNIPEGIAVGVAIAGALVGNAGISLMGALVLSIGIALQNFPEGAIVSLPLRIEGSSRKKAFWFGTLTGAVEPVAAILTIALTHLVVPILPYLLSFAAGAMIYVVVEELIPQSQDGKHSNLATVGFLVGFVVMMILDITIG
ncbi:MAG: ZIP family metal transporter [Bacilli bacterium]|jgi:ZIP family zinc transporter|nr:ZIP family metal transporter [Bacilli bacterium]NLN80906.1 ZIP family metal transporter [Erysipelotrichia bacterium]